MFRFFGGAKSGAGGAGGENLGGGAKSGAECGEFGAKSGVELGANVNEKSNPRAVSGQIRIWRGCRGFFRAIFCFFYHIFRAIFRGFGRGLCAVFGGFCRIFRAIFGFVFRGAGCQIRIWRGFGAENFIKNPAPRSAQTNAKTHAQTPTKIIAKTNAKTNAPTATLATPPAKSNPNAHRAPRAPRPAVLALAATALFALLAPLVCPYDPAAADLAAANLPPCAAHPFGTDLLGRDMLARTAQAVGLSAFVGLAAAAMSVAAGVAAAGLAHAFWRGFWLAVFDALLALPSLLVALFAQSVFGGGLVLTAVVIAALHFAFVGKVALAEFTALQKSDFYQHCVVLGYGRAQILGEFLPNFAPLLATLFALNFAHAVGAEAVLGFFGLGAGVEVASLGGLLRDGASAIFAGAWWQLVAPMCAMLALLAPIFALCGRARFAA